MFNATFDWILLKFLELFGEGMELHRNQAFSNYHSKGFRAKVAKRYLVLSLSNEIWQFQPDSRPIFSEKTLDLNSFSLLKWTKRTQARSNRSINWTISVCAWYCIVTMPINTWWHCISKQPATSLMSSSLLSENSNESVLMEWCKVPWQSNLNWWRSSCDM